MVEKTQIPTSVNQETARHRQRPLAPENGSLQNVELVHQVNRTVTAGKRKLHGIQDLVAFGPLAFSVGCGLIDIDRDYFQATLLDFVTMTLPLVQLLKTWRAPGGPQVDKTRSPQGTGNRRFLAAISLGVFHGGNRNRGNQDDA